MCLDEFLHMYTGVYLKSPEGQRGSRSQYQLASDLSWMSILLFLATLWHCMVVQNGRLGAILPWSLLLGHEAFLLALSCEPATRAFHAHFGSRCLTFHKDANCILGVMGYWVYKFTATQCWLRGQRPGHGPAGLLCSWTFVEWMLNRKHMGYNNNKTHILWLQDVSNHINRGRKFPHGTFQMFTFFNLFF